MALAALVREDVLDHAIWTVAVVSHPVVADHHRYHSHGIGLSCGSGGGDRGRDRSRNAFSALTLTLSLPPASGGAGSHSGGSPNLAVQEVVTHQEEHQGHQ